MSVKMKQSGIEWIGEIPEHWNFTKLKYYYNFEKGKNAQKYTIEYIKQNEGSIPVYSGQTENEGIMGSVDKYEYDLQECLFTTTVGAKVMTPKILQGKFCLSQNCLIMKQKKLCDNHYFYYYLIILFDYEKKSIPAYMQPSLRVDDLNKYGFYIPPIEEQRLIAVQLNQICGTLDNTKANIEKQIEILNEYKKSVITEAVTKGLDKNVELKDSGIDWIGKIPEHWNIIPLKYLCFMKSGKNITTIDIVFEKTSKNRYPVYGANGFRGYYNSYTNCGSYCIVGRQGALAGNVHFVSGKFWATDHAVVCYSYQNTYSNYLYYLLFSMNLNQYAFDTAAQPGLSVEKISNLRVVIPPIEEQEEIVTYLDSKCSEIDSIIENKKQQLELLEEYKKSIIYEYVTGKREVTAPLDGVSAKPDFAVAQNTQSVSIE